MPVPGVLAGVLGEGIARHAVTVPSVGNQCPRAVPGVGGVGGKREGLDDAPKERKSRKWQITKESVLPRKSRSREGESDRRLRMRRRVLAVSIVKTGQHGRTREEC